MEETAKTAHRHIDDDDCLIADSLAKEYGDKEMPEEDEKFLQNIALAVEYCTDCRVQYNKFHRLHL